MNFPCPNVISCACDDLPFENLTAEGVDSRRVPGFYYGCAGPDGIPSFCEAETTELAELCAARDCEGYQIYYSREFTGVCPTNEDITYTVESGSFIGLSQQYADDLAQSFADNVADLMCDGSPVPPLFDSTAQSCSATCGNGTVLYATLPGMFKGVTQEEADGLALDFACEVAALLCSEGPDNPQSNPLANASAFNNEVPCSIPCPGGGTFSFLTAKNTFRGSTAAQADAMAYSYACQQAQRNRFCISSLPARICVDAEFNQQLTTTGFTPTGTPVWSISAGTLPTGMTFSGGVLSGTPTSTGTFNFTVRLTASNGIAEHAYTLIIFGITNSSLDPAVDGEPYLVNFTTSSGDQELQQWSILAGTLPDGLELTEQGVLQGTPTESSDIVITVRVLDSTTGYEPLSCTKDFESDDPQPISYWDMNEAGDFTTRFDAWGHANLLVTGDAVPETTGIISFAAGMVNPGAFLETSPNAPVSYLKASGFTILGWFKAFALADATVFRVAVVGGAIMEIHIDGTDMFFSYAQNGSFFINCLLPIPTPDWHFLRCWYDPEDATISIQWDMGTINSTPATAPVEGASTYIGFGNPAAGLWAVDEWALFDVAVSDAWANHIYNAGAGATCCPYL